MNPIQRIQDWLRERRIARLGHQMGAAYMCGDKARARALLALWQAEFGKRSPQQLQRMQARDEARLAQCKRGRI